MHLASFLGEVARPFSIITTSIGATAAIVIGSLKISDGIEGAAYIAAVLAGLVGLYGFKAWENRKAGDVEIAKAGGQP